MQSNATDCWNDDATDDNKCSTKCPFCNKGTNKYQCYEPCDDGEPPIDVIPVIENSTNEEAIEDPFDDYDAYRLERGP